VYQKLDGANTESVITAVVPGDVAVSATLGLLGAGIGGVGLLEDGSCAVLKSTAVGAGTEV